MGLHLVTLKGMKLMKTELLVAPKNLEELTLLAEAGASAFVVGDARFALVVRGSFQEKDLEVAVDLAHSLGKKLYLLADAIIPSALLTALETYLQAISHIQFDAIRVADLGAYMLIKQMLPNVEIHFVDAMMLTNYYTVNYWAGKGMTRARLAHELTLEEVLEIKNRSTCEIEVLIHGAPLMFSSRRKLVDNYLDYQARMGKNVALSEDGNFLFDKERELYYPITQNEHGTHIYGGNDVCMIDDLAELLAAKIDVLYIEGFTYKTEELVKIIQLYKMAIHLVDVDPEKYAKVGLALYAEVEKLQAEKRRMDRGFYYKPTIYKNQNR